MSYANPDITGYCEQGTHVECRGTLTTGMGYHWWCVCPCHPEPVPVRKTQDATKALAVWRKARAAFRGAS